MSAGRTITGKRRKKVIDLMRAGCSNKAISAQTGIAPSSIQRIRLTEGIPSARSVKGARLTPEVERPAEPSPDAEPAAAAEFATVAATLGEELERLNRQRALLIQAAEDARKDGNHSAATSNLKTAAELGNTIARMREKSARAGGGVTFSKEELEHARRKLRDTIGALAQSPEVRGGVCPRCGEQIRINWSEGRDG